jgi:hypothetical protein
MLLGVIKSTEIIWEELAKGQVYEVSSRCDSRSEALKLTLLAFPLQHEDVHLGMATLEFSTLLAACYPPQPVSSLRMPGQADAPRIVTVDEVLHALSEALGWIMEKVKDETLRMALMNRLTLRIVGRLELEPTPKPVLNLGVAESGLRTRDSHFTTTNFAPGCLLLPRSRHRICRHPLHHPDSRL